MLAKALLKLFILICLNQSRLLNGNKYFFETNQNYQTFRVLPQSENQKISQSIIEQIKNKSKIIKNLEHKIKINNESILEIESKIKIKENEEKYTEIKANEEKYTETKENEEKYTETKANEKDKQYFLFLTKYNYLFENFIKEDLQNLQKKMDKVITIDDYIIYLNWKYSLKNYYKKKNQIENYIKNNDINLEKFKELKSEFFKFETDFFFYDNIIDYIKILTGEIYLGNNYFNRLNLTFEDFNKENNIKLHSRKYKEYGNSIANYFFENLRNESAIISVNNEIEMWNVIKIKVRV